MKDFDEIASELAFFEQHATEAEEDARAYQSDVAMVEPASGVVRMLDFGCGSGRFTARFLEEAAWPPDRLRLTLVEPAESTRREALNRLARYSSSPIAESSALPIVHDGQFDVVLANHVLYYVPDLADTLRRLIAALAPQGCLLLAIAARSNLLCELWTDAFTLLGREVPYNTSEDVATALRALNATYEKQQVPYRLSFADSRENRLKILRFLLADHLAQIPREPLLARFDQFSRAGRIDIHTASDHYTLKP